MVASTDSSKFIGDPNDFIIPILGQSGVGKSTFINQLLDPSQRKMEIGHGLETPPSNIIPTAISPSLAGKYHLINPAGSAGRVVLIDTPGFNVEDTTVDDAKALLKKLDGWLKESYNQDMKLGGIIYLHDISQARLSKAHSIKLIQEHYVDLAGLQFDIALGTTKWEHLEDPENKVEMLTELLKGLIGRGTRQWQMFRVTLTTDQTLAYKEFIDVLRRMKPAKQKRKDNFQDRKRGKKFVERRIKKRGDGVFHGKPSDVVIPVMGPTGVGKSTFINSLSGSDSGQIKCEVGHTLESCTTQLLPVVIPFNSEGNQFTNPLNNSDSRLILVDTPGFEDTHCTDAEILRRISVWLALSYTAEMKLAGVVYLHDITQTRMLGMTRRSLGLFRELVGKDALKCVVLGTTKWDMLPCSEVGIQRQQVLESHEWRSMIEHGARVLKVNGTPRKLIQLILDQNIQSEVDSEVLAIQKELVNLKKFIPETAAGKTLRYTIQEIMELQKQKADDPELLTKLQKLAKELKVPLSDRIKRFFSS